MPRHIRCGVLTNKQGAYFGKNFNFDMFELHIRRGWNICVRKFNSKGGAVTNLFYFKRWLFDRF